MRDCIRNMGILTGDGVTCTSLRMQCDGLMITDKGYGTRFQEIVPQTQKRSKQDTSLRYIIFMLKLFFNALVDVFLY